MSRGNNKPQHRTTNRAYTTMPPIIKGHGGLRNYISAMREVDDPAERNRELEMRRKLDGLSYKYSHRSGISRG